LVELYIRVAFESLEDYKNKSNRRVSEWNNTEIDNQINQLFAKIKANDNEKALKHLHLILQNLANQLTQLWEKEMVIDVID